MRALLPAPCPWVVGQSQGVNIHCGKLPSADSAYCPKHALLDREAGEEARRAAEQRKAKRAYKEEQQAMLATSPLRADNPAVAPAAQQWERD